MYICGRGFEIRPATTADTDYVAEHMRADDLLEIKASHGLGPKDCLSLCVEQSSVVLTILLNKKPAMVGGFGMAGGTVLSRRTNLWALGAGVCGESPFAFMRAARVAMAYALSLYDELFGWVDAEYKTSIRFIEKLGGKVYGPQRYGVSGKPFGFYRFVRGGA